MGRSRGGLTTKIHALVDAEGRPIDLVLTAGQAHDGKPAAAMLDALQPDAILLADRAYDSDAIRTLAAERKAWANIPRRRTGPAVFLSAHGSTGSAISSSDTSTNLSISEVSQLDMTAIRSIPRCHRARFSAHLAQKL